MKLSPITAMRARDVSRPRAEHVAEAEAAEAAKGAREGRPTARSARTAGPGASGTPSGAPPGSLSGGEQVRRPTEGTERRSRRRRRA